MGIPGEHIKERGEWNRRKRGTPEGQKKVEIERKDVLNRETYKKTGKN